MIFVRSSFKHANNALIDKSIYIYSATCNAAFEQKQSCHCPYSSAMGRASYSPCIFGLFTIARAERAQSCQSHLNRLKNAEKGDIPFKVHNLKEIVLTHAGLTIQKLLLNAISVAVFEEISNSQAGNRDDIQPMFLFLVQYQTKFKPRRSPKTKQINMRWTYLYFLLKIL